MRNYIVDHIVAPIFAAGAAICSSFKWGYLLLILRTPFNFISIGEITHAAVTGLIGGVAGWTGVQLIQWIIFKIFPKKKHKK